MQMSELVNNNRRLTAVFGLSAVALLFWMFFVRPVRLGADETVRFTVKAGQGTVEISRNLKTAHLIRNEQVFAAWVYVRGWADNLQAGTYLLSPSMRVSQIASLIASGSAINDDITITIPEGLNVWDIDMLSVALLHSVPGQFSAAFADREGHLFPDTYRLPKDATYNDLGRVMFDTFNEKVEAKDPQIIIASILEKEAKSAEDMALVSGIIAKRLELGMPLQVDAAVAYGWCNRTMSRLRACDVTKAPIATEVKIDGAYNMYTRKGLPRGPISNPGMQALEAARLPRKSQSLYYLSTRDGSRIIYSRTLEEHLQNRKTFLGF